MAERKIVIGVDSSEQAEHAFEWYLSMIHKPDNQIILVHCSEVVSADQTRSLYVSQSAWQDAMDKEQKKVKEMEEKYNTKILERGLSGVIKSRVSSKPGEVICSVAEEEKATMIVMGTRGLGKVRRTIMGSVSDYVVHHAHCPVIVCRK